MGWAFRRGNQVLTMDRVERSILVAVLCALAMAARAAPPAINSCIPADGSPLYADGADKCKNAPIRKLNSDGSQKDPGMAPLMQEQRRAKEQSDRNQARCSERNKEQYQRDIALLDRYPSEDDLQEARYRVLGDQIKQIDQANERLKELIAKGRDFAEKAKFFEPPHQMPDDLRKGRDLNRELEQNEFRRIAGAAREIQRINDKYDVDLKRYRELVDGTAKRPCDPKND
jgi:hypothetical protein